MGVPCICVSGLENEVSYVGEKGSVCRCWGMGIPAEWLAWSTAMAIGR